MPYNKSSNRKGQKALLAQGTRTQPPMWTWNETCELHEAAISQKQPKPCSSKGNTHSNSTIVLLVYIPTVALVILLVKATQLLLLALQRRWRAKGCTLQASKLLSCGCTGRAHLRD